MLPCSKLIRLCRSGCTASCGKVIYADKSVEASKTCQTEAHFFLWSCRESAQRLGLGPVSTTSCLLWSENLYRLVATRKGRKRHFIKHIRMCFKLLNIARETKFQSPTYNTDDPAVQGTCSCSEANLVLTAEGKRLGTCRAISVSSASFQISVIQHSTVIKQT